MRPSSLLPLHFAFLLVVLAVTACAQDQPWFRNSTAEARACREKLNWVKCYARNLRGVTLNEDPALLKREAQICTPECIELRTNVSPDYIAKRCGAVPDWISAEQAEMLRIQYKFFCSKDETGKRSCAALSADTLEPTHFVLQTLPARWSHWPKDYACSKCLEESLQLEKETFEWQKKHENRNRPSLSYFDSSETGMQARAELCNGWTPRPIKSDTVAAPAPTVPSSALPLGVGWTIALAATAFASVMAL